MRYFVSYEHSLKSAPDDFIVRVPSQLISDVPATVPPVLLTEFLANMIRSRSPLIGKIRNLHISKDCEVVEQDLGRPVALGESD